MKTGSLICLYLVLQVAGHGPANTPVTLYIDDNDPVISYTGNWAAIGPGGWFGSTNTPSFVAYGSTVHQTQDAAAGAVFSFIGTDVSIYGFSNPGGDLSMTYSIDGESPIGQMEGSLDRNGDPALSLWFSALGLAAGNHIVTMTMSNTPCEAMRRAPCNEAYFILDQIAYYPPPAGPESTTSEVSSQPSDTTSITQLLRSSVAASTAGPPALPVTSSSGVAVATSLLTSSRLSTRSQSVGFGSSSFISSTTTSNSVSSSLSVSQPPAASTIVSGTSDQPKSLQTNSHVSLTPVIVGVILGVALVIAFLLLIWYRRKLRRVSQSRSDDSGRLPQTGAISPSLRTQALRFQSPHQESGITSQVSHSVVTPFPYHTSTSNLHALSESGPSSTSKTGSGSLNALIEDLTDDNVRLERLATILQHEMDDIPSESGGPGSRLDLRPDVEEGNNDVSGVPPPYDVTQRDPSPVYGRV